jgi:hypothetical protein
VPEKSLFGQLEWTHIWLVSVTAMWGGAVSYFRRIQDGQSHSWFSAFIHMATSGFAGLMCWLGCIQFDAPLPITAMCTGLAGHMGAEFVRIVETRFRAEALLGHIRTGKRSSDVVDQGKT